MVRENNQWISKQDSWRKELKLSDDLTDITNLVYNFNNEFIDVEEFNTKFDPKSEKFYIKTEAQGLNKIKLDRNFNPKYPKNFGKLW